jgi:hypothetical protein
MFFVVTGQLPVVPNNGDHHFSKLFNVEETKGIIHSRIYPACDVVQSEWYNISGAILSLSVLTHFMRTHAFFFFVANAIVLSHVFRGHWSMC